MIPGEVLAIIACPVDKKKLRYDRKREKLVCTGCRRVYDVDNGVPVLLADGDK